MIGVYKITSPTKRVYIGQSIDIQHRWNNYRLLRCKGQPKLYRSLKKHGFNSHMFEVLIECDKKDLNKIERFYQESLACLKTSLNCVYQSLDDRPYQISESTRRKLSNKVKGDKHPMFGMKGNLSPHYVVPKTKEHKYKLMIANIGKKYSDNVNLKKGLSGEKNSFWGKKHSDAQLRKYVVEQSNPVKVIHDGKEMIFECVQDCAEYFNCTSKNVLFRDRRRRQGIDSKFGMFKGVYLEIIKN